MNIFKLTNIISHWHWVTWRLFTRH